MIKDMKYSIITVCKNCGEDLHYTLVSIFNQTYSNKEIIVVDGKSTDETCDILEKYNKSIDQLISEPDTGIYNAMNKGIALAKGDFVFFLNCGDAFYNENTLKTVNQSIIENTGYDIYYGDVFFYSKEKCEYVSSYRKNFIDLLAKGINHQTIFFKKEIFKECIFNEHYKIFADYDLLLKLISKFQKKFYYINIPITYYKKGGFSSKQNPLKYWIERREVIQHNSNFVQILAFAIKYPKIFYSYLFLTMPPK